MNLKAIDNLAEHLKLQLIVKNDANMLSKKKKIQVQIFWQLM